MAAALLADRSATDDQLETALTALLADRNSLPQFVADFGPRKLLARLSRPPPPSDALSELADAILAACDGGLAPANDMAAVHRDELYPDERVPLAAAAPPPSAALPDALALRLPHAAGARFPTACCRCATSDGGERAAGADDEAHVVLRQLSRREKLGAEISLKIQPSAHILARWLWSHRWLAAGCASVLEIGCGAGLAGLAAARCGAGRVLLTDLSEPALAVARQNAALNDAAAAVAAARFDWADPPALRSDADGDGGGGDGDAMLRAAGGVDLLLAADVVNDDGLSELVLRVVETLPRAARPLCDGVPAAAPPPPRRAAARAAPRVGRPRVPRRAVPAVAHRRHRGVRGGRARAVRGAEARGC